MPFWTAFRVAASLILMLPAAGSALTTQCNPGPYMIFFDFNSAYLNKDMRMTLDNADRAYDNCGTAHVVLEGHVDARESPDLAQERQDVVRTYLERRGIRPANIIARPSGMSRPAIVTENGVSELQNRRVDITYEPS